MENINDYKFVLCPRGVGTDTHRFWEVLLTNSIPIVEKNNLSDFYKNFPCIIVNKFSDINKELLNNFITEKGNNINKYLLLENFEKFINEKCKY